MTTKPVTKSVSKLISRSCSGQSIKVVPIIGPRADTNLITADSTLITADSR